MTRATFRGLRTSVRGLHVSTVQLQPGRDGLAKDEIRFELAVFDSDRNGDAIGLGWLGVQDTRIQFTEEAVAVRWHNEVVERIEEGAHE